MTRKQPWSPIASFFFTPHWQPPVESCWVCDCVTVITILSLRCPLGLAFVFAVQWSDTAASSISLSAIIWASQGQIVPLYLLAGEKITRMNHATEPWITKWAWPTQWNFPMLQGNDAAISNTSATCTEDGYYRWIVCIWAISVTAYDNQLRFRGL